MVAVFLTREYGNGMAEEEAEDSARDIRDFSLSSLMISFEDKSVVWKPESETGEETQRAAAGDEDALLDAEFGALTAADTWAFASFAPT